MRSYRFARRSFLAAIGGAFGLRIMLDDFEAMAQGVTSPPRFLMTHWPVGAVKYLFLPNGGVKPQGIGTITEFSSTLKPFADAGLKDDMTLIWGFRDTGQANGGGGHEAGTPMTTTSTSCPGTRQNGGEGDDGVAGGPSWDQIFLEKVVDDPVRGTVSLKRPGIGYANAICDERIDSQETSTRCLSYGYQRQRIQAASGGTIVENVPLLPELSPAQLYLKLFTGFMPGGNTPENMETARRALMGRKSVLDYCMRELDRLKTVAPAAEAQKIDIHAEVCRKVERQVSDLLNGDIMTPSGCVVPEAPDPAIMGKSGSKFDYANPATSIADDEIHHEIGKLHAGILLAAFQCDIIRVGTFQWSPGTNHVSFKGLYPGEPNAIYMHHPKSHEVNGAPRSETFEGPSKNEKTRATIEFLNNVHTWYNEKTAEIVNMFKNATDAFGGNMLDTTIIAYVTEVAEQAHSRSPKAALYFGGKALGMQGGKYVNFEGNERPQADFWATIAQAYFKTNDPMQFLADHEFSAKPTPIQGLWVPV